MKARYDYDSQADLWSREEPKYVSDFVARPRVLERVIELGGSRDILDGGCGEGYFCRKVAPHARTVTGLDVSKGMIDLAKKKEQENPLGINYLVGDIRKLECPDSQFDIYVSNCVANYLYPEELSIFYGEASRVLRPDGHFVVLIPDIMSYLNFLTGNPRKSIWRNDDKPFWENISKGTSYEFGLGTIYDEKLSVMGIHSDLEDHQASIKSAGLELQATEEIIIPTSLGRQCSLFDDIAGEKLYTILSGRK